ncbi:MAG: hypothetical protein OT477_16085 [Chloroflexi bacterium]|nr:hypothetical protein [Chloroflexota bacterium]
MSDLMTEERIVTVNEMGEWVAVDGTAEGEGQIEGRLREPVRIAHSPLIVKAVPLFAFPDLTLEQVQKVEYEDGDTIIGRFDKFHARNPHVYQNLRKLALAARRAGQRRSGTKALFEILRYATLVTTGEVFKLNNNFTAIYARMLMREEPELRGFFTLRERRAL